MNDFSTLKFDGVSPTDCKLEYIDQDEWFEAFKPKRESGKK